MNKNQKKSFKINRVCFGSKILPKGSSRSGWNVIIFLLLVFVFSVQDNTALADDEFEIKHAEWNADKSELQIKGEGEKKLSVTISNAHTAEILAEKMSALKDWDFTILNPEAVPCRVKAEQTDGAVAELNVTNAPADCDRGPPPTISQAGVRVLAANDLGMHCADKDYQIMSILPPFNVIHAQVIQKGTDASLPRILSNLDVEVNYTSTSNPDDPAGANSINTTSQNANGIFKTNFWETQAQAPQDTLAGLTYALFYPAGVFSMFEPLPADKGIPVPDVAALPALIAEQQAMPGISNPYTANEAQEFLRYDKDVHFFGSVIPDVNWFAADGVPIMPVDDAGRSNAYPLMKVAAKEKASGQVLDAVDVVLPVASEAECQNCHADPDDDGDGAATTFASVQFDVVKAANAPGPEQLQNAAKINILRLHDAKHGLAYTSSIDASPAQCDPATDPSDPNCLANQTPVQCAQCHYSPALDLAQLGPIDEPAQGVKGRQQTRHVSMSRAMHFNHADYKDSLGNPAFPSMPEADDPRRTTGLPVNAFEESVLEESCYQCHPGTKTQCLRGAMFSGGVVCQDCHGEMKQVGDDFSEDFPAAHGVANLDKRIPWAVEPKCQSCHTGDALTPNHPAGGIIADDGIRLIQAYVKGDTTATPIKAMSSRFAENQSLYRLSGNDDGSGKGHGGVMCEGCHGSTHAIWPNANPLANDNVTANQIQGHTGSIVECESCHAKGTLGNTLDGPHGMHPVGGGTFADGGHEKLAETQPDSCRSCHGQNGEGTVLSKVATDRSFVIEECEKGTLCSTGEVKNFTVKLTKGEQVGCALCHQNEL